MARRKFYLNRQNGVFMGVCAGIARTFGWEANWVRVAAVVVTLLGAFPWTLIAYGLAAWLAKPAPAGAQDDPSIRFSTNDLRLNTRDIDRRMAEVDAYVASSNNSLANEIEKLR